MFQEIQKKDLILRITFLGSIEEFIMVNQIQGTISKFYELRDEFKTISNLIVALNNNLEKQIKKFKDKDFTNPKLKLWRYYIKTQKTIF